MSWLLSDTNIDFFQSVTPVPYVAALQTKRPLVHCITNTVVQNFTANLLLAVGASPAMIVAAEEVAGFAAVADGLLINIGTVTVATAQSMLLAAAAANAAATPWVFDPVGIGAALPFRTELAQQLMALQPTVVRCNASEILVLDQKAARSKGMDSLIGVDRAILSAQSVAAKYHTLVVLTGAVDYVTDGTTSFVVKGGHASLTRITGAGCALSALVAALIGSNEEHLPAAATACALMARASELANADNGMGSFAISLLDQLSEPLQLFTAQ